MNLALITPQMVKSTYQDMLLRGRIEIDQVEVLIFISETINYKRHPHQEDDLEFLFIQVSKFKLRPFIVGTWNRPPWVCNRICPKIRIHFERTGGLWAGG